MKLFRRLRYWLRQRRFEAELAEEMRDHRERAVDAIQKDGMSREEAETAARRRFGNVTLAREQARSTWIWPWLESVWQDVAYAGRTLRRQPGFTGIALVVLGIAIGLNASLFTVLAGMALRPLAGIARGSDVVFVSQLNPLGGSRRVGLSVPEIQYLSAHARSVEGLVMMRPMSIRLGDESAGDSTDAVFVSANFFDVLGVTFERGRGFAQEENRRESPQSVVVLGYELWRNRLGGDPGLVGGTVTIEAMPFRVIGIASRHFAGADHGRLWIPLASLQLLRPGDPFVAGLLTRPTDCCVNVAGRLSRDSSKDEAEAELTVLSNQFRASVGQKERPIFVSGTEFLSEQPRTELVAVFAMLAAAMMLVLFMACANVGNLVLARASARAREIGARLALGASRGRLVRQLVTEGFVLALVASAIGLLMSFWMPPLLLQILTGDARPFDTRPDTFVVAYALAVAALSCLVFALAPALHATRLGVADVLKGGALAPSHWSLRTLLLATQVALSVVLLVGAGLLGRGLDRLRHLDLGFSYEDVSVVSLALPPDTYDDARLRTLMADLSAGLQVSLAAPFGFASFDPFGEGGSATGIRLPGDSEAQTKPIDYLDVSPGYFEVLRIPIVAGRNFENADAGRDLAVINEAMARRYWPGQSALGQSFISGRDTFDVIGIARDAQTDGFDEPEPEFYRSFDRSAVNRAPMSTAPKLLLRSTAPGSSEAIVALVRTLDERVRVEVRPLAGNIDRSIAELAAGPAMAAVLGFFALALAVVGMFGVFSYIVRQRKKEIGIRMALGAGPVAVVALVLAGNARALVIGLVVGLAGALAVSRVLQGYLYGLSPLDPATYGGVALLLAVAGFAASYGPVRQATRTDPATALREN